MDILNKKDEPKSEELKVQKEEKEILEKDSTTSCINKKTDLVDDESINFWKERYLRLYAEQENNRKRMEKDRLMYIHRANKDAILSLLPTLDDLNRALEGLNNVSLESESKKEENYFKIEEGLKIITKNLSRELTQKGIEEMKVSIGDILDPNNHMVLSNKIVDKENLKNRIAEVVSKGYLLNGKVIRTAQVLIGK